MRRVGLTPTFLTPAIFSRSSFYSCLACAVLLLVAPGAFAAPVIEVNTEHLRLDLPPYVDVFEDKNANIPFADIKSEKYSHQFAPSSLTDLYFGYTKSAYWLRFAIENQLDHDQPFVFEVLPADIDSIDFYGVDYHLSNVLFHKQSGSAVDFGQRDYDHPLYYFDINIPAYTTVTYYVRLESNKTINAQLTLSTPREQFFASGARDWWQGFIFGALLFTGIIHLGLFFVFNYKGFLYCGLLVLSMVLIQGSWNGYFLRFLATDSMLLDRQLMFSVYLSAALGLLFTRTYLNTHQRSPFIHRILTWLIVLCLMGIPCSWLFASNTNALLVGLVSVPAAFFIFGVAIYSFLEGYEPARYFLLARTASIVMILAAIFSDLGLLPQGFVSVWGLSATTLLEGIVFAFAMVHQQLRQQSTEAFLPAVNPSMHTASPVPVSAFCHELRTPISGVMGMTELLLDTPLTEQQRLQMETIHESGKALLGVVNKMSDLASLENGELELVETTFEILSAVESCIEHARNMSERRNIELMYQVDETLAGFVKGDEEKLQQVLSHLVSYGVRHLESGEILLTVKQLSQDVVLFEVIAGKNTFAQDYSALYEAHPPPSSADSLNLTIAKQFVALLGGELLIYRRADGGLKASFKLSLRRQRRDPPIEDHEQLLRGKRLMVVDDNDTCCKIVKQQASQWGMDVVSACSGKEALALLRSHANLNEVFDLILVDYDMPGMNGLELVAKLKQEQEALKAQNMLIMILTGASKMPAQIMDKQLGIYRTLYKPLSGKNLKAALIDALQRAVGGSA